MKKVKDVFYGICVLWLLMIGVMYTVEIAVNGLISIDYYELRGWELLATIVALWTVLLRYPVKQWVSRTIKEIKMEFNARQKEQKKQNQVKTA